MELLGRGKKKGMEARLSPSFSSSSHSIFSFSPLYTRRTNGIVWKKERGEMGRKFPFLLLPFFPFSLFRRGRRGGRFPFLSFPTLPFLPFSSWVLGRPRCYRRAGSQIYLYTYNPIIESRSFLGDLWELVGVGCTSFAIMPR